MSCTLLPEKQPKKLKLKSALKNSSSSLASPVSETNPQFAKYGGGSAQRNRSQTRKSVSSPIENPRKELTPEEMYALALKAAEKKVYGDRLATVYPDNDIDDDTKLNTIVNMQAPKKTVKGSQPVPPLVLLLVQSRDIVLLSLVCRINLMRQV